MDDELIQKIKEELEAMMEVNADDTQSVLSETFDFGEYVLDSCTLNVGEPEITNSEITFTIRGYVSLVKEG